MNDRMLRARPWATVATTVVAALFNSGAAGQEAECCPCDLDGSGSVTNDDYLEFTNALAQADARADLNADGAVDSHDLSMFQECWRSKCDCLEDPFRPGPSIIASGVCGVNFVANPFVCLMGGQCMCKPLVITFDDLTWSVCVMNKGSKGLAIGRVFLKSNFSTPSRRQILKELSIAEIFVPYHDSTSTPGNPPRYYDTQNCPAYPGIGWYPGCMRPMTSVDLPAFGGAFLQFPGDAHPRAIVECRDYGPAWLCKGDNPTTNVIRRGHEVVIWGVQDTGNYDSIIEYHFRDDGRIMARLGTTGYNSPGDPFMAHMHNVLWRVDIDLAGPGHDSVTIDNHIEPSSPTNPLLAGDFPDSHPTENFFTADPETFRALRIEDTVATNAYGNHIGYEIVPFDPKGLARHFGPGESWTQFDFAVTAFHPGENGTPNASACAGINTWAAPSCHLTPNLYLFPYLERDASLVPGTGPETVFDKDLVVWYHTAGHHHVTDEDRALGDPANDVRGITLIHWQGIDLAPHDFFNANPLGGPMRCGN